MGDFTKWVGVGVYYLPLEKFAILASPHELLKHFSNVSVIFSENIFKIFFSLIFIEKEIYLFLEMYGTFFVVGTPSPKHHCFLMIK